VNQLPCTGVSQEAEILLRTSKSFYSSNLESEKKKKNQKKIKKKSKKSNQKVGGRIRARELANRVKKLDLIRKQDAITI
jgi:hypothetical protein